MENMLDKEYFHFGTDNIRRELWLDLYMQNNYTNYSKPLGGLWCSPINNYNFCDWLIYKEEEMPYDYDTYVSNRKSCLVKFKDNKKLLAINTKNDFKNLKDSGMTITLDTPIRIFKIYDYIYIKELPDYEKINSYYDLLYISPFADETLYQYSVNTMLALKIDSIEYYKPIDCDYYSKKIDSIGEKHFIKGLSNDYIKLLKYLKELLTNYSISSFNKNELLKKLLCDEYVKSLLPNDIDNEHMLGVAIINSFNKIQNEKKLNLHN